MSQRPIVRLFLPLLASAVVSYSAVARADVWCDNHRMPVTYYSLPDQPLPSSDPRCSVVRNANGVNVCRIALKGMLYRASGTGNLPAIVVNHGSEHSFNAGIKGCEVAKYFLPLGYHVFVPFRRGQGDIPQACTTLSSEPCADNDPSRLPPTSCPLGTNESTGQYISEALANYTGPKTKMEEFVFLLDQQTADVIEALKWLRVQPGVASDKIALMGSSYGGIMTVMTNAKGSLVGNTVYHTAAVAFSPGSTSWSSLDGNTLNTTFINAMVTAASNARRPTYYLAPRYDYDTRAATELAYVQANGYYSYDAAHMAPYALQIFDGVEPPIDDCTGYPDYHSVHAAFPKETATWGPSVLDFLQRAGVK